MQHPLVQARAQLPATAIAQAQQYLDTAQLFLALGGSPMPAAAAAPAPAATATRG